MPGKKKKKFIDKNNAVTFSLVHRSQRDPLQADEDAPQRVLVPTDGSDAKQKEEQQKFGIYFDDNYDYLQHLRGPNEINDVGPGEIIQLSSRNKEKNIPALKLPPSVFASSTETEVGMLNLAAPSSGPRLDWDPEVVAALDDDFNFEDPENELEDNFMEMAMGEGEGLQDGEREDDSAIRARGGQATIDFVASQRVHFAGDVVGDEEDADDVASDIVEGSSDDDSDFGSFDGQHGFPDEETKSRFTSYSMTSSVIRRSEGLTLIDDRFEKLYEEYDDEEIGALDHDDISGCVQQGSHLLNTALEDFEKSQNTPTLKEIVQPSEDVMVSESEEEDDEDLIKMVVCEKPKEQWDCESILSTYSNLYNHPKTIEEPKKVKPIVLTKRAQIPADSLAVKETKQRKEEKEETTIERAPTYRPHDETLEEKKDRKEAIKMERKLRREQKKATKTAFKDEKKKQVKELLNVQKNVQGMKLV